MRTFVEERPTSSGGTILTHVIHVDNGYHKHVNVVATSSIISSHIPCCYQGVQPGASKAPDHKEWEATIPCAKGHDESGLGDLRRANSGQIEVRLVGRLRVGCFDQNYPMPTKTTAW